MGHPMELSGNWNYPTRIVFGAGRIDGLPRLVRSVGMRTPLLVTDPGLAALPMVHDAVQANAAAGFPTGVFSDVKGNPVESNVNAGIAAFRAGGHDGVIAFGGGSALDAGKAIAFMVGQDRPIWDFEDVGDNWRRGSTEGIAPVIAVPTTAGTGSEVGRSSVIANETSHEKKIIFHPSMMPAAVLSDPELTVGLPPHITAATGLDAFTHCFEAFCAPGWHPMADGIALEGMRLVAQALLPAYRDGGDIDARARMLAAASMGATAFQKGLGGVHAISHAVSALYDTHHGLTNAVVLPYVMRHNEAVLGEKAALVGRLLNLPDPGFASLLDWCLRFREDLGIPADLGGIGVDAARAEEIGEIAGRDPTAAFNPVPVTAADLARVFENAVAGRL